MPTAPNPDGYLDPRRVAALLHSTATTVRNWTVAGCKINGQVVKLRCEFVGARYFIRPEWVEDFKLACTRARDANLGPTMPPAYDADAAERRAREVLAEVENW